MVASTQVEINRHIQPRGWFTRRSDACGDDGKTQRPFEAGRNKAIAERAGQGRATGIRILLQGQEICASARRDEWKS